VHRRRKLEEGKGREGMRGWGGELRGYTPFPPLPFQTKFGHPCQANIVFSGCSLIHF